MLFCEPLRGYRLVSGEACADKAAHQRLYGCCTGRLPELARRHHVEIILVRHAGARDRRVPDALRVAGGAGGVAHRRGGPLVDDGEVELSGLGCEQLVVRDRLRPDVRGSPGGALRAHHLLRVWFLEPATRMNPHLRYAQAIPGVSEGRGIGIIDTRHLPQLVDALRLLERTPGWTQSQHDALRQWMRATGFSRPIAWTFLSAMVGRVFGDGGVVLQVTDATSDSLVARGELDLGQPRQQRAALRPRGDAAVEEAVAALGREVVEGGYRAFKTNIVVPGDEPHEDVEGHLAG